MATVTMTAINNILKEVYEDGINDQLQSRIKTLKRIPNTTEGVSEDVGGKYVRFAIRTGRNQGMGARLENEVLPIPLTQAYESAQLNLTYQYGSIQMTGQTFELAQSKPQVFASELQNQMSGLREGLAKDMNRQVYGTSIGKLATFNAAGTTTTAVMANSEAIYLEAGMVFDLYSAADALVSSGHTITNIQRDVPAAGSTTITFTPATGAATASGQYITRTGSRGKEVTGFRSIVNNTGVLYNIDGATVPLWRSVVDDPGAPRNLSEGLMINMADSIYTNGTYPTVIFTSLGVRRAYFNLLVQQRRYTNTKEFDGGFTGLAFTTDEGDIPVIHDVDCPWNTMFFINEKEIKLYQTHDWSFMNRDGSNWQRTLGVTGGTLGYYDAYISYLYKYCQIGTHRRNAHGVIRNIIEA